MYVGAGGSSAKSAICEGFHVGNGSAGALHVLIGSQGWRRTKYTFDLKFGSIQRDIGAGHAGLKLQVCRNMQRMSGLVLIHGRRLARSGGCRRTEQ